VTGYNLYAGCETSKSQRCNGATESWLILTDSSLQGAHPSNATSVYQFVCRLVPRSGALRLAPLPNPFAPVNHLVGHV